MNRSNVSSALSLDIHYISARRSSPRSETIVNEADFCDEGSAFRRPLDSGAVAGLGSKRYEYANAMLLAKPHEHWS